MMASPSDALADEDFEIRLSRLAKDEMSIVDRLRSLREATEKLPKDWTYTQTTKNGGDKLYTRDQLIAQLEKMELTAAERWSLLLYNLANQHKEPSELSDEQRSWREALRKLDKLHFKINQQLDQYNAKLKDGILLNLARQVQVGEAGR